MKSYIKSPIALISLSFLLSFSAIADDKDSELVDFIVSQFKQSPDASLSSSSSSTDSNFVIEIGTVYDAVPGSIIYVPVTLNYSPYDMYGFDFLINFDYSIMQLIDVEESAIFFAEGGCDWE